MAGPLNVEAYPTKLLAHRIVDAPAGGAELAARNRIAEGDTEYLAKRYAAALEHYLAAWNLVATIAWPWLPQRGSAVEVAERLLALDLGAALLTTSAARLATGHGGRGHVAPPPAVIAELAREAGVEPPTDAEAALDHAIDLLAAGRYEQASRVLGAVVIARRGALAAKLAIARASAALRAGRTEEARGLVDDITGDGLAPIAAHLIALAYLHDGDEAAARPHRDRARTTWPRGATPPDDVTLIVPRSSGAPAELPIAGPPPPAKLAIATGVTLELDGDVEAQLAAMLAARAGAQTLAELRPRLDSALDVVAYLVHVRGLVLPLSIGDCYARLGEPARARTWFLKARDYAHLNVAIEVPMLWCRLAATYLDEGRRCYFAGDLAAALAAFRAIAKVEGTRFEVGGPAYEGAFTRLAAPHLAFLEAGDLLDGRIVDGVRRTLLAEAVILQRQIAAGLDFAGVERDPHPVHPWTWLQQVALQLAAQARQAERAAIQFLEAAEREQATRQLLEHEVGALSEALRAEERSVAVAQAQLAVATESVEVAVLRYARAQGRYEEVRETGADLGLLDELQAYLTGAWNENRPLDRAAFRAVLGYSSSAAPFAHEALVRVARERHAIHHDMQLRDLERERAVLAAAQREARAQRTSAEAMVQLAGARRDLAELRREQANERLAAFEAELFTPEVWRALADRQSAIASSYLAMAIGAARRLERAFELEYDVELDVIRPGYATSYAAGVLAADELLLDIDRFTQLRLEQTAKRLPVKVVLSLAEQYPRAFVAQFSRTGRLDFQTHLRQLDELHPGLHLCKLRRVEVIFEGLLGALGVHGTLRCAGFSEYRDRTGAPRSRLQPPEAMALSAHDLRRDGFVFATADQALAPFEDLGVATSWTLELSADAADLDFGAIANAYLVLYFDGAYSSAVEQRVRAELAATTDRKHQITLDLGASFPDAFFALQDSGEVGFELARSMLPWAHAGATIDDLRIVVVTADGTRRDGILVELTTGDGAEAQGRTDADGQLGPLDALRGRVLAQRFTIRMPPELRWESVTHVFFVARYAYQHRLHPAHEVDGAALTWAAMPGDSAAVGLAWSGGPDQLVRASLRGSGSGRIGVVARAGDGDLTAFVLDRPGKRRRLIRRQGGTSSVLAEVVFDDADGAYELDRTYDLRLAAIGTTLVGSVDGVVAMVATDPTPIAGRAGVYRGDGIAVQVTSLGFESL